MLQLTLAAFVLSSAAAVPPVLPPLSRARAVDFRIEVGREPYLLRIGQDDLRRLSEAIALGEDLPKLPSALVVREDIYPPYVERGVPPELARRAAALWRLVEERGWAATAGVEWDPELGHPRRVTNDRGDILRDAPGPMPGSRAGVWVAPDKGAARDSRRYGVRCVESLSGPKRCFRIWPAGPSRGRP
ncbi:MAG: hypothetical protein HY553_16195 [Elusimicrobia bacterium]|nr:hypothetical protein [Elusimicrobiota bacterium]